MREPNRKPRTRVEAIATSMSVKEVFPMSSIQEKDPYDNCIVGRYQISRLISPMISSIYVGYICSCMIESSVLH